MSVDGRSRSFPLVMPDLIRHPATLPSVSADKKLDPGSKSGVTSAAMPLIAADPASPPVTFGPRPGQKASYFLSG
jgi:hypothetical protein